MSKIEDEKNQIVNNLIQNPAQNRVQISKSLKIPETTVQRRIRELISEDRISPGFIVNEHGESKKFQFWIMIDTQYLQPDSAEAEASKEDGDEDSENYQIDLCQTIAKELAKEKWSSDITILSINIVFSAPWDILLSINSTNPQIVGKFIVQYLRTLPSVLSTSTAWSPPKIGDSGR